MSTKLEKCALRVNDEFTDKLKAAFVAKFDRALETNYNIFSMALISHPADGEPFTQEQKDWVTAFDDGYTAAMEIVRAAASEGRS
jgi:hypothetical protein